MHKLIQLDIDMFSTNQNIHRKLSTSGLVDLAQRIANIDSLVQILNKLQVENSVLKTQLTEYKNSADYGQLIYREENMRANRLQSENQQLLSKIDDIQSEVTRLNGLVVSKDLYYNKITENSNILLEAERKRSSPLNALCHKPKEKLKEKLVSNTHCPELSATPTQPLEGISANKNTLKCDYRNTPRVVSRGTQYQASTMTKYTCTSAFIQKHDVSTNFPELTNKNALECDYRNTPRVVSRGTQYQASTMTRYTCTSAFIQKHDVSTNFPELTTTPFEDIFQETIIDFPALLSPICDIVDPSCCVETQTETVTKVGVTVGTCTDLHNIQKCICYVDDNKKNLHPDLTYLWDLLGQTIFALICANDEQKTLDFCNEIKYIGQNILNGKNNQNSRFSENVLKRENISSCDSLHHESYDVEKKYITGNKSLLMESDNHVPKIHTKIDTCVTHNASVSPNYSAEKLDVNAGRSSCAADLPAEELKPAFVDHEIGFVEKDIEAISPISNRTTTTKTADFDVAQNSFLGKPAFQHLSVNRNHTITAAQYCNSNLHGSIGKNLLKRKSSDDSKKNATQKVRCINKRCKKLSNNLPSKAISNSNTKRSNKTVSDFKAGQCSFTTRKYADCNAQFKQEVSDKAENSEKKLSRLHVQDKHYPLPNVSKDRISLMLPGKLVKETCAENSEKSFTMNLPVTDETINLQSSSHIDTDEDFHGFELHDLEIDTKNIEMLSYLTFSPRSPDPNEVLQSDYQTREIPLERVCEFDVEYSPASPLQKNMNATFSPKEIPLNRTNFQCFESNTVVGRCIDKYSVAKHRLCAKKAKSDTLAERKLLWLFRKIMEKYIMNSCNMEDCLRCARSISKRSAGNLIVLNNAICEVIEDTNEDISNEFTPPAIVTTHSHRKMILLIKALNQRDIGFEQQLIAFLEQKLFNFKCETISLKALTNLFLLYLSLVDTRGTECSPARLILYKCLYYYSKMSYPLAYYILVSYPEVLPSGKETNNDSVDPLTKAIQCILNSQQYDINNVEMKHRELFHILRLYYEYELVKPSREELVDLLISKIQLNEFENVNYSFGLICKRNGVEWSIKYVLKGKLVPLLEKYTGEPLRASVHDEKVACVLDCMSIILKPFPVTCDIGFYRQIFARMLCMYKCQIVQEAAVLSILRTCRFGYEDCCKLLYSWNPPYRVSNIVRLSIQTFVHRSTLKKLKKLEKFIKDTSFVGVKV